MQASVLQDARYGCGVEPEGEATTTIEIYKRYLRQTQAKAATAKAKTKGPDNSEQARRTYEAGASLEPTLTREQDDLWEGYPGDNALDIARRAENDELVRMLEDAARLRYSIASHRRFPPPARYAAAELLRLGYQIGSGVLVPVWAEHVIPFLVSRTSRGAVPTLPRSVVFIDALSDDQVGAMLEGDYAEHATLEIERRAVERLVRSC